jgi:flagellar biosynthesis/type III secretory pathway protein FliH
MMKKAPKYIEKLIKESRAIDESFKQGYKEGYAEGYKQGMETASRGESGE